MILEFKNVTGKQKGFHLSHITFSLEEGYLMGISGKNGAGKSTLLKYIMDADSSYEGKILVLGKDIQKNRAELMNEIGFISEENSFLKTMSAEQNAKVFGSLYHQWSQALFESAMQQMEVPIKTPLNHLSRGEFFKFQTAFAIAHKSKLYLIDEATAGMDIVFRRDFFRLLQNIIKDETASVLLVTHIKEELEIRMDYILHLENGEAVSLKENGEEEKNESETAS